MQKTQIGLIGCGTISDAYFATNAKFSFFDIAACADLNLDAARAKAEKWGIPRACSVEQLLADPDIEFVINLTIPAAHGPVMLQCLEAGKSVYTEKPFTVKREEAQKIMALASEKNLRVGSAPDTFLGGAHQTVRELVDSGAIGEIVAGTAFMAGHGPESWHPAPAFYYKVGGGPMFDMGPYYLTDLVQLIGPIKRIAGAARTTFAQREITSEALRGTLVDVEVPTHIAGTLEFENGAVVSMMTSFDVWGHSLPPIEVHGTLGSISVPDPNNFGGTPRIRRAGSSEWEEVPLTHGYTENSRGIGMADMVSALQNGRDHRCNERVAYHVLDAMHAFHDSSDEGRFIELESTCERPTMLTDDELEG